MQVMVALRIFAAGAFQLDVADTFGVAKPTVCRTVHCVATVMALRIRQYVQFERPVDRTRMASFPNVIGCIDCTHVSIIGPSVNEHELVNRKGVQSINVQLLCNADMCGSPHHLTRFESLHIFLFQFYIIGRFVLLIFFTIISIQRKQHGRYPNYTTARPGIAGQPRCIIS